MDETSRRHVEVPRQFNAATYYVDRNLELGFGGKTALIADGSELSYSDVATGVDRCGNAFRSLGLEMENRVALLLPDRPEWVYGFFGAMKIGAVPVPFNTLLTVEDYLFLLRDSRARILVCEAETLELLLSSLHTVPTLRHVIAIGEVAVSSPAGPDVHNWNALVDAHPAGLEPADTCSDDVAFWLYTSGTTGSPSAAIHLHHDMVYCLEFYGKGILESNDSDRSLSVAKLFFAYGLGNSLYIPFGVGGSAILEAGRATPEAMISLINRYQPTLFYGVPTWYAAALQAIESGLDLDSSSLRLCISAGEPLSAGLYQRWLDRTGVSILDGIGTTEVLHIFISNRPHDIRPGSTGRPVPGYEVKLVDDDAEPTPVGDIGNLMVRGESICAGYWNKHAVTTSAIEGEWMRTRDKYHLDSDGYFWYEGRSSDMLKVGGRWVSPAEVEAAVAAHPAVLECAVVGVRDAENLETPKAVVVLREKGLAREGLDVEIQEFVRERLAPYKYPRVVEFVDSLPKTATGKIQRFRLRPRS